MKTTIDIDEKKLKRIMALTGLKTRKAAVDYALTQAERAARIDRFFSLPFFVQEAGPVVDPDCDLMKLREMERPTRK